MHPNIYYHVDGIARKKGLFNIIEEAELGKDIELWGSPTRFRDMVYVKDCCQIIEKCITHTHKWAEPIMLVLVLELPEKIK